jgi:DNA polymerase
VAAVVATDREPWPPTDRAAVPAVDPSADAADGTIASGPVRSTVASALAPSATPQDSRTSPTPVAHGLAVLADEVAGCVRCPLARTRTQVVFGVGNPDADLMFVGEAPGFHEDQQGVPFVGQAGKLLDRLLGGIGMTRADVYIANVLKCRPPGNRDPQPEEIEACEGHLFRQIGFVRPRVVATLGNFATKLLSGRQVGITRVHGQEQEAVLGGNRVHLYPLYHPAAALYTPAMLKVLEEDFARLPALLGRATAPPAPVAVAPEAPLAPSAPVQLGLF